MLTTKISNYLHSDAISSNILPLFKVPDNEDKHCHIDFQCRVVNIGEKGIEFLAKFTVKENIKIKVQDRIIKEMLGVEEALELTVTKSWQDEATKRNYFYGEFPELTSMQKQKVRRYISDYISKA